MKRDAAPVSPRLRPGSGRGGGPPARRRIEPWHIIAAIGLLLIAGFWLLRRSPYAEVRNLGSRGSSIIAFGDSLTAGYGAPPGDDYPSRLSKLIGQPVVNAGVSGDTTEAALARIDTDVLSRDPRMVIVGLGGNDLLRGIAITTTEQNLRAVVAKIQQAGAMVVLLGFQFPTFGTDYAAMYARVAKQEHCLLVRNPLRGILTDGSLKSDEIHPNAKGYALMADRIAGPCSKLLRTADAAR